MQPVIIAFRADANPEIGTGHIMRCLALAEALKVLGGRCIFLCRAKGLGALADRIHQAGHKLHLLPEGPVDTSESMLPHAAWLPHGGLHDAVLCRQALTSEPDLDWLVVDHYALDEGWESALRDCARCIFCIDDTADRPHACDLLLDQNFYISPEDRYCKRLPAHCRQILGPHFALLQPFYTLISASPRKLQQGVRRILVCFGGSDSANYTGAALQALEELIDISHQVEVIVGENNPHAAALSERYINHSQIRVLRSPPNLPSLLADADLGIGAGGVMCWERACMGLPSVAFGIAANQAEILANLCEAGLSLAMPRLLSPCADFMRPLIATALSVPELLRGFSQRSLQLVDGRGAERVAEILCRRVTGGVLS